MGVIWGRYQWVVGWWGSCLVRVGQEVPWQRLQWQFHFRTGLGNDCHGSLRSQRKQSNHLVCIYSPQSFTSLLAFLYLLPTFLPCMFSLWLTLFPRAALPHCLPLCEKNKTKQTSGGEKLKTSFFTRPSSPFPRTSFPSGSSQFFLWGQNLGLRLW